MNDANTFFWVKSIELGPIMFKIKNRVIGVLLTDITEGMALENAVNKYEKIVSPTSYQRPKPVLNQQMIEIAQRKIEKLGYSDSLARRYAHLSDININDILFVNRNVKPVLNESEGIFSKLTKFIPHKTQKFEKAQDINLKEFVENILPTALEVELYLSKEFRIILYHLLHQFILMLRVCLNGIMLLVGHTSII